MFLMRHRSQVGGGKRELQHIVNVIALNMVCPHSRTIYQLHELTSPLGLSQRVGERGLDRSSQVRSLGV